MRKIFCKQPGCFRTVDPSTGHKYCIEHQSMERAEQERQKVYMPNVEHYEWNRLYNSPKWKALRDGKLEKQPTCEKCGAPATEVHHIVPHRGNLELFLDWDNLMSLCSKCHRLETIREAKENARTTYERQKREREVAKRKLWY